MRKCNQIIHLKDTAQFAGGSFTGEKKRAKHQRAALRNPQISIPNPYRTVILFNGGTSCCSPGTTAKILPLPMKLKNSHSILITSPQEPSPTQNNYHKI